MSNDLTKQTKNLPANYEAEADNLLKAAREDGFEKRLTFNKGKYVIGKDDEVPLGTEYVAHASQWTKRWIKFVDDQVVNQIMGKVADGFVPPRREDLDDRDESKWEAGLDGRPKDPWTLQYLLPLENLENGEVVIFITPSVGGRIAVADLCEAYARRAKKGSRALPIIKLAATDMQTKKFGKVPRPHFEITSWDETPEASNGNAVIPPGTAGALNDEIPFE